jgi:hypothetical protein
MGILLPCVSEGLERVVRLGGVHSPSASKRPVMGDKGQDCCHEQILFSQIHLISRSGQDRTWFIDASPNEREDSQCRIMNVFFSSHLVQC